MKCGDIVEWEAPCSLETSGKIHAKTGMMDKVALDCLKTNDDVKIIAVLTHQVYESEVWKNEDKN